MRRQDDPGDGDNAVRVGFKHASIGWQRVDALAAENEEIRRPQIGGKSQPKTRY
jgi:hypothetical protein